jgi:hypothetical protein
MTLDDMQTELIRNYDERYHEEEEYYDPEGYEEYLNGLTDEKLTDLYEETFGDS